MSLGDDNLPKSLELNLSQFISLLSLKCHHKQEDEIYGHLKHVQEAQVEAWMMVRRFDESLLSAVSIATTFTSATGFSILVGMAGALETLCGQAYGAKQYQKLGIYTNTAIISLMLFCVPIMILWIFADKILVLAGQEISLAREAWKYSVWLIPNLFSYAILQSLTRYFQSQSLFGFMLFSSIVTLLFHVPLCWALVIKLKLGSTGAALAIDLSSWYNVLLLVIYVKSSSACAKTRAAFSKNVFSCMREFYRFAIPSAVMVCLEWWSYVVVFVLSGLLKNPNLETSVLSTCLNIVLLHSFIPYGIGASVSTRVSNELGAGNPLAAKVAVSAGMVLAVGEVAIVSITLYCCGNILGDAFSNDKEIVSYISEMVPLVCLLIVVAALQMVLSGVARGSGWQHIGALVNLSAYCMIGIPLAAALAFDEHLRGKGLLIGLVTGSTVAAVLLGLITSFTDWQKQASKARKMIFEGNSQSIMNSV